jgi:formamidopyrimidine-DNA glycosylase
MPELPEVETIRLGLQKYLLGREIQEVEVRIPKMFSGNKNDVIGAKIIGLKRIGKSLIIELNNDFVLAVHLKMTGQLIYQDQKTKNLALSPKVGGTTLPSKYTHIIFKLNDAFLYYNDLRQFGWIKVVRKDQLMQIPFFKEMGPEPLVASSSGQAPLSLDKFKQIISKGNSVI